MNPALRSNASFVVMFNNKQKRYVSGLYQNVSQLFDQEDQFRKYFVSTTAQKYTTMLYDERENDVASNYTPVT